MSNDNGGPAFPGDKPLPTPNGYQTPTGMTLLDHFAGQALAGLLASGIAAERCQPMEEVAEVAYANASAMIAQRNKGADT